MHTSTPPPPISRPFPPPYSRHPSFTGATPSAIHGGGNGREMGGGGVDVCIYRGGDGQPGAIPDEVRLRDREGEVH